MKYCRILLSNKENWSRRFCKRQSLLIKQSIFQKVYVLQHRLTKIQYAAKTFFKQKIFAKDSGRESLINEIKILREINHHSLLRLEEVFETDNSFYMITNLLPGGNLLKRIRSVKSLSEEQTGVLCKNILNGLAHLQKQQIMHRDIKPENIMFIRQGCDQVCLVDFGLAEHWDNPKYLFSRCGTPGFVAPEIANEKNPNAHYTGQCDLYSLGCVMHISVLGKPLFYAKNYNEMLALNKQCKMKWEDKIYCKLSFDALDFLKKLLEINPIMRMTIYDALKHPFLKMSQQSENVVFDEDESSSIETFMNKNCSIKNKNITLNLFSNQRLNTRSIKMNQKSQSTYNLQDSQQQGTSPTETKKSFAQTQGCNLNKNSFRNEDSFQLSQNYSQNDSMLAIKQPARMYLKSGGETSQEEVQQQFQPICKKDTFLSPSEKESSFRDQIRQTMKNKNPGRKHKKSFATAGKKTDQDSEDQQQQHSSKKSNYYIQEQGQKTRNKSTNSKK